MVSLAHPHPVASSYRLESGMDVRRIRSFFTGSHCWVCTASALRPFPIPAHSRLCWCDPSDHRLRLGYRRPARGRARRLSRPQAVDDSRNRRLFGADGLECTFLELAVFCRVSLSGWTRDRHGMGDGGIDYRGALASERTRQGWRPFACRIPDRQHSCRRRVVGDRHGWPRRLAIHVFDRGSTGPRRVLDPAQCA